MSRQEGDGPDPTEFGGPLNPAAEGDYLRAAAGWLDSAETARSTDTPEADRAMWGAARLAELNLAMAQTINDLTPRYVLDSTIDVEHAVREQIKAENADYVAAMEKRLAAQLKADDEAHQAVTLRPGADPEPEAEGELWTADGETFAYAVYPLNGPGVYYPQRWLIVKHYAQVLRWQNAPEPKSSLETWEGLDGKIGWADDAPLRRPTAEERSAFYGPEPETPEAHVYSKGFTAGLDHADGGAVEPPEGPVRFDRFDATVEAFSDEALIVMREAINREQARRIVKRERPQRAYTEPEDRGMFRDRG